MVQLGGLVQAWDESVGKYRWAEVLEFRGEDALLVRFEDEQVL